MADTIIERHDPPSWIVERVLSLGGSNVYGRPNFRVTWGGNRYHTVGGMFKHVIYVDSGIIGQKKAIVTQVAEVRQLLAYHPERWHLERWCPAEYYGSSEDWYARTWDEEAQLHTLGPYPHEGEYEHVFFLGQCSHMKPGDWEWCQLCKVTMGEYIPLEPNFYMIEMQIRALLRSENVNKDEEARALFKREVDRKQAYREHIQDVIGNAMRPHLALQPTSWQAGTGSRCSVPEAKWANTPLLLPSNRKGFHQSEHAMPAQKQAELEKDESNGTN